VLTFGVSVKAEADPSLGDAVVVVVNTVGTNKLGRNADAPAVLLRDPRDELTATEDPGSPEDASFRGTAVVRTPATTSKRLFGVASSATSPVVVCMYVAGAD
jgi:hypothetical protein